MNPRNTRSSALVLAAVTGTLWPLTALAEGGSGGAAAYLTQLIGGLVLVIGAIVVLGWILRRTQGGLNRGSQVIEIVAARSVGTRERLVLVQVGDEQVLVGVAPSGMRTLHTMRESVVAPVGETPDFSSALKRAVTRRAPPGSSERGQS
ncbi:MULTISPECIES: flagellar biosynthetic protein FliO [unclassified Thioalkalivibrio]|uniref:flagellar biosynthetic protein FliO n=1 Tax=unclassified Thioalkalivibrio TaxID=2621013 RepID=UPI0004761317|nr:MULTISPECIES: flagellar biosynthetic protein FliO [unclassified Thioalkalivibrio]